MKWSKSRTEKTIILKSLLIYRVLIVKVMDIFSELRLKYDYSVDQRVVLLVFLSNKTIKEPMFLRFNSLSRKEAHFSKLDTLIGVSEIVLLEAIWDASTRQTQNLNCNFEPIYRTLKIITSSHDSWIVKGSNHKSFCIYSKVYGCQPKWK